MLTNDRTIFHTIFTFQVIMYFWNLSGPPHPSCPPWSTSTFPCADVSLSNELGCRLVPCFQALHTPTAFHSRALTQAQTLPECHFKLIKPFSHRPPLSPCISRPCFSLSRAFIRFLMREKIMGQLTP